MPFGDGTGPCGQGPMTGRGMGFCNGFNRPGFSNPGFGRGFRNWFKSTGILGWRRAQKGMPAFGRGFPINQNPTDQQKLQLLEQERQYLEDQWKAIQKDLENIKQEMQKLKENEG